MVGLYIIHKFIFLSFSLFLYLPVYFCSLTQPLVCLYLHVFMNYLMQTEKNDRCCIAMNNYTYTYTRRNIFNTIRTSEDTSLGKYTSHFIESVVCERELETKQNCNILTPTLMAITAFLSHTPGLLNRGPSLSGTWSSFQHLLSNWSEALNSNCNCSVRGLRAPSAGCCFSLPHLISNWAELPVAGVI